MRVVVAGVGQLYQSDLDLGRRFVEAFQIRSPSIDVVVEDFYYGAVAVSQRLEELSPDVLILVGATERGRTPGTIRRRRVVRQNGSPAQDSVESAIVGHVSIDLILDVTAALGTAPDRVVVFEVEPDGVAPSSSISESATLALGTLLDRVKREILVTPLYILADEIAATLADDHLMPGPSADTVRSLLAVIATLEEDGQWGRVFSLRDRLRIHIAEGDTSEGMSQLDWSLWWALIEELDRLQRADVEGAAGGEDQGS